MVFILSLKFWKVSYVVLALKCARLCTVVCCMFQMLLWDSIGAVYFSGRSFSTWLQNLLVTTICPFIFQLLTSTIQHALNLLQASSFGISIMDIAAIIASTVFSIAFHEFGHAVAAARSLFADLHFLRDVLHVFAFICRRHTLYVDLQY